MKCGTSIWYGLGENWD